ncbi:MAG: DUF4416 family protein [Gemmataceae bacterium]|nr:DUF4416 family protein [Gemmataceae bacterium]
MISGVSHPPALLLLAAFTRHSSALDWAATRAGAQWGPIALASKAFDFTETDYYQSTMGSDLKKIFWVFERPLDPAQLASIKRLTINWEHDFAALVSRGEAVGDNASSITESRPLNLDPGYLTTAKLVLASTKDHTHRIYLRDGIFAEATLFFRHGRWEHHEWTFPDYRRADYQEFFSQAREFLKRTHSPQP